ncbi:sensor histidine kinase [Paenibacillus hodogayensis]|uniref:Sensor histidine kinase n=1 Tax=Paenibacillus hodogayensis TaxID=279208 RepID=A0ABV5VZT6_9BACL
MRPRNLSVIMVLCLVGINALFLTTVTTISYRIYSQITFEEVSEAKLTLMNETVNQVSTYMKGLSQFALYLVSNEFVIASLSEPPASSFDAVNKQRDLTTFATQVLAMNRAIHSIEMYTDRFESFPIYPNGWVFPLEVLKRQEQFSFFEQSDGAWLPQHLSEAYQVQVVSYIHRIHSLKGQTIGFVKLNILADHILVNNNRPTTPYQQLLLDIEGRLIASNAVGNGDSRLDGLLVEANEGEWFALARNTDQSNHYQIIKQQGKKYVAIVSALSPEQWRMMQLIPLDILLSKANKIGQYVAILGIGGLLLSIPLAFWIVRLMVSPIRNIIAGMRAVEDGNFEVRVKAFAVEEYAALSASFNKMAQRLQELLENLKREHKKKREVELHLLQSQIKPHFLYNTLDMIYWRALDYKADDIGMMINQLGKLFRIGLNGGHLYIKLRDELEHVKCYLRIQKARLHLKIDYNEDIPAALMGHYVPKIIFQPFIENSIMHGYGKNGEHSIVLEISGRIQGEPNRQWMELTIRDNGIGYRGNFDFTAFQGIGVRNVHERIQLYCGDDYGVRLSDHPLGGAVVTIRLPLIDSEDKLTDRLDGHHEFDSAQKRRISDESV